MDIQPYYNQENASKKWHTFFAFYICKDMVEIITSKS